MRNRIFVSYSHRNDKWLERIEKCLAPMIRKGTLELWSDKKIDVGEDWREKIAEAIASAKVAVLLVSIDFLASNFIVKHELEPLLKRNNDEGMKILWIPVEPHLQCEELSWMQAAWDPARPLSGLRERSTKDAAIVEICKKIVKAFKEPLAARPDERVEPGGTDPRIDVQPSGRSLYGALTHNDLWKSLEQIAIRGALAGGMAAMGYYRDAWRTQHVTNYPGKNPSTVADEQATISVIQTLDPLLHPLTRRLGCGISYLAEETADTDQGQRIADALGDAKGSIHSPEDFFRKRSAFRVIVDGIDGTANFSRGIPLFCTAVAFIVGNTPRIAAIYDPIHHVVYSGRSRCGPKPQRSFSVWNVAGGSRIDMADNPNPKLRKKNEERAIGIHLTRSHPDKLRSLLRAPSAKSPSQLEQLSEVAHGIYAFNSGALALVEVARGGIGAFVNNVTKRWDVAAGQVLVEASGGVVKDFRALNLKYSDAGLISVVAALDKRLLKKILSVVCS